MDRQHICFVCRTEIADQYVQYWNMGLWMTYCRDCDDKVNTIRPYKKSKPCEIQKNRR